MVRQSDVKGAYSRVGDPSVKRSSSSSSAGRWVVLVGFLAVTALFVGLGRNGRSANDDNDRSGQAHHPAADTATTYHQQQYEGSAAAVSATGGSEYYHVEEDNVSRPSGEVGGPLPASSYGHDSSSPGERGEDDGYEEPDEGARTVNRPGSTASTASEDGDGTSDHDDEDIDDASKDKPDSSKEDEEDDDGDDHSVGADSDSKSSHNEPGNQEGTSTAGDEVPVVDETNPYEASSTDADMEEKHVVEDLKIAEAKEVKAEEAKAQSTLGKLGSSLRIGLGKLFGDKATDQEIEDIAVAVEAEVTTEVNQEIEVASEQILEDEVDKVRDRVQRLRDDGTSDASIAQSIVAEEPEDVTELRHSVDEIESRVEQSIRTRESMAEKKILEDKLSKKLGKKVKLTFVEQEERFDGMDEVMKDLPSLRGSSSSHKKKKKKHKRSAGGGGETKKESESQPSSDSGDEGDW